MWEELDGSRKKLILILLEKDKVSLAELCRKANLAKSTVQPYIKEFEKQNILKYHVDMIGYKSRIKLNKKRIKKKVEYSIKNDIFYELIPTIPAFLITIILMFFYPTHAIFMAITSMVFAVCFAINIIQKVLKSPKFIRILINPIS